ncbi:hypothetical protein ACB092_06G056600 [Castanea dentata]
MAESAANQSESKCKKMKLSPDKDTAVGSTDRISNLPDSLLCHILCFLPTNDAIVTSILSSRWKPLWTLVPKIDLHDKSITGHSVSPLRILYSVLAQHTTHPSSQISPSHGILLVTLPISTNGSTPPYCLPHAVFHSKTLESLELSGEIELDPPPSFQLPSLKILGLYEICYTTHYSFSSLCSASACPSLEDLKVLRDDNYIVTNFKINVPTLKRLHIEVVSYFNEFPDFKLEIYAPVLEYFHFFGDLRGIIFLEKLANLVEARINVSADNDWIRVFQLYYGDRVFKLLKALSNAKFLSIFPGDKECIGFGSIYPSMFQNLVRLNFKVTRTNWHVLQSLLVVAPNLEVLVIDKNWSMKSNS